MFYYRMAVRSWRNWIIMIFALFICYQSTKRCEKLTPVTQTDSSQVPKTKAIIKTENYVAKPHVKRRSTLSKRLAEALNNLKSMAPDIVDQKTVKRILLVTTFRTGSTFLGALLQEADPLTYYHYEPLHFLTFDWHVGPHKFPQAKAAVEQLFQCDMKDVFYRIRKSKFRIGVVHITENKLLSNVCTTNNRTGEICQQLSVWEETCRRSRVQLMKLTRLDLKDALKIELPPDTKIVYLQRDPRGIYSSRKRRPWCGEEYCQNIARLCRERESDVATLKNLTNKQVIVLRFEDFVKDPMKESEKLFKMLGLDFSDTVKEYVDTHTKLPSNANGTISKVRDSKKVATTWKQYLTTDEIREVQEKCANVFKEAGYELD